MNPINNFRIISEIASNWNGSENIAKQLIWESKQAGADYVKFQMWRAEDLYKKSHPNWNEIKKSELTPDKAKNFKKYADRQKIGYFCSAFYPEAVEFLEKLDVQLYKIASRTSAFMDKESLVTMQAIAKTRKPVIISMGFGGDMEKIKKIFKNNNKYFLYCISKYPTLISEVNFQTMLKMDGFSDHTEGSLAALIYAVKSNRIRKIKFIEKHVSINQSRGPDKPFSMDINDFAKMIHEIRLVESIKV
jgi:sialic acid synthase SpsE